MNEEQAKQYVNEKCKGLPVTSEEDARKVLDIIWKAACEWKDSQVGEPVAFTNAYQLEYLKDPKYSTTPMAMWAKPFNEAAIALYLRRPTAQINQQLAALLEKSLHWLDGLCDAGPLGQQYTSDELTQFVDEIRTALAAATQMRGA